MREPIDFPKRSVTIACIDCKGLGTLGGSYYVYESCKTCEGTGRIEKVE